MKKLSIIVPCYNEQETIYPFLEETQKVEQKLKNHLVFDYIFVSDGSKDETLNVLHDVISRFPNIHYLSFSRNSGKETGLLAGLEAAGDDLITIMDADLQDPSELLINMYQKILGDYDVVRTRRADRKGEPVIRFFFLKVLYKIVNAVSDTEIVDGTCDFRLTTRQVVDSILELGEVNRFSKGIFSWVGYDVAYIAYENREHVAGETSWNFQSLLKYSMERFTSFSETPLDLSLWAGAVSFLASILGILFIIVRRLTISGSVTDWASLVCIILFIGGIQLLALGVIGKYISKTFLETKKRPVYIVKERRQIY